VSRQKKQKSSVAVASQKQDSKKRQGRRFLMIWIPVIVIVLLIFYVVVMDPPRPVGQPIAGTSKEDSEKAKLGDSGGYAYMVALDDGRVVAIEGSMMGALKSGRRVLVQENVTLIFKRKHFSFVRYLE
jgi:ABC-type microcin C transport system permease subunit YejB